MNVRSFLALAVALLAAVPAFAQGQSQAQSDPVVARVNGAEIHRSDVLIARQSLPPQLQQIPFEQIYPRLLDEMVNNMIIAQAGRKAKLADDPEVKRRLAFAQDQIIEEVYLSRLVRSSITEDKIKARYDKFVKDAKPEEQVSARHILLKNEDDAKAVIAELKKGTDFATLAKQKSEDPGTKASGGDLGWFSKDEMVPEFSEAAFKLQKGEFTETPVKTQFGYHVIKVDDRRQAPPPTLDQARPQIVQQMQREIIEQKLKELRTSAKVETFALDGSKAAPASSTPTTPTAPTAPAKKP